MAIIFCSFLIARQDIKVKASNSINPPKKDQNIQKVEREMGTMSTLFEQILEHKNVFSSVSGGQTRNPLIF